MEIVYIEASMQLCMDSGNLVGRWDLLLKKNQCEIIKNES